jgi:hypothetical protein
MGKIFVWLGTPTTVISNETMDRPSFPVGTLHSRKDISDPKFCIGFVEFSWIVESGSQTVTDAALPYIVVHLLLGPWISNKTYP